MIGLAVQVLAVAGWFAVPSAGGVCATAIAGVALLQARRGVDRLRWRVPLLLAFVAWCAVQAGPLAVEPLVPVLDGVRLRLQVRIAAAPSEVAQGLRVVVRPRDATVPERMIVLWPDAAERPAAGECWHLRVRLGALGDRVNPGGFDRRAWLLRRGIGAQAVVLPGRANARCARSQRSRLSALRARVRTALHAALPTDRAEPVLRALSLGERGELDRETRALLSRTGTAHLVAISGLHIGLAAGFAMLALRCCPGPWRRRPALSLLFALPPAGAYAALSGFALPAQRALLALTLIALLRSGGRPVLALRTVAIAAVALAAARPRFVADLSFVLSFAAVVVLALSATRARLALAPSSGWRAALQMQCLLSVTLLPLTAIHFGFASLQSLLANAVLVPVYSLFVVPLALMAAGVSVFSADLAAPLWSLAAKSVGMSLALLAEIDRWPLATLPAALPGSAAVLVCIGASLWFALANGVAGRAGCALVVVLPMLAAAPAPGRGCVDVTMLDVGHGTAIVVRGATRTTLIDTGPGWPGGGDAGARHVLPLLTRAGVRSLQVAVLSHDDADHTGGAASVGAALEVERWLAGPATRAPSPASRCERGQRWHSAGVTFEVLWPLPRAEHTDNDRSCVVRIRAGRATVLAPGDIEARAERDLVALRSTQADVVIAPHHGSDTSSTPAFVATSRARLVVFSADPGGRWQLPDAAVVARWRERGAERLSTGDGAQAVRACRDGRMRSQDPDPWGETRATLW